MVVYSFYIFDRHSESILPFDGSRLLDTDSVAAECIYSKLWARQDNPSSIAGPGHTKGRPVSDSSTTSNDVTVDLGPARARPARLSAKDDAKLIFGTIFSLRNMVRKLGGEDDRSEHLQLYYMTSLANAIVYSFISYRTGQYKLHYYETPTSIKFVMLTDTQSLNMRNVLHQIYVNLYVEFGNAIQS